MLGSELERNCFGSGKGMTGSVIWLSSSPAFTWPLSEKHVKDRGQSTIQMGDPAALRIGEANFPLRKTDVEIYCHVNGLHNWYYGWVCSLKINQQWRHWGFCSWLASRSLGERACDQGGLLHPQGGSSASMGPMMGHGSGLGRSRWVQFRCWCLSSVLLATKL